MSAKLYLALPFYLCLCVHLEQEYVFPSKSGLCKISRRATFQGMCGGDIRDISPVFAIVSRKGNLLSRTNHTSWSHQWKQSCRHFEPPKLECDLRGSLALRLPSHHPSWWPNPVSGGTAEMVFCDYFLFYVLSSRSINFRINLWLFRWTSKFAYKWFAPLKTSTRGHIKPKLI